MAPSVHRPSLTRSGAQFGAILGVASAAAVVGLSVLFIAVPIPLVIAALVGALVAGVIWLRPRLGLVLLLVAVSVIYWFTTDVRILPDGAKFAKELLLVVLFSRALATACVERTFWHTPIDKWLFAFVILAVISGIANAVSPIVIALAMRGLFQYALVFYTLIWLRRHWTRSFFGTLMTVAIALALLQLPVGVWQFVSEVRSGILTGAGDSFRGTLGESGANLVGLFTLPFLFYILSRMFDSQEWTWKNIVLALALALVMIISSSRMAWFCAGVGILMLWAFRLVRSWRMLLLLAVFLLIGIVVLDRSVTALADVDPRLATLTVAALVSPEGIVGAITTPGYGIGLTAWGALAVDQVLRHAPVPLLGLGPGSGGSSVAVQLQMPVYMHYFYDAFDLVARGLPPHVPTQVLQTGIEYGPLGVFLLFGIAIEFYLLARKARRLRRDPFLTALGAALTVQVLVMVLVSFKDGIWEQQAVAMWLWLLGGIVFVELRKVGRTV